MSVRKRNKSDLSERSVNVQNRSINKSAIDDPSINVISISENDVYSTVIKEKSYAVTRRGYILSKAGYTDKQIKNIRKKLTMVPKTDQANTYKREKPFKIYLESKDLFYGPKFFFIDEISEPVYDSLGDIQKIPVKWNSKFNLRPHQIEPVNAMRDAFIRRKGGILQLGCGSGKTVDAIYGMAQLKVKTVIVVPTVPLVHQWDKEIQRFTDIPDNRIGYLHGKPVKKAKRYKKELEDKWVIIAVINSLASPVLFNKQPNDLFSDIGLTIFDEIHNYATRMFSQAFPRVQSRWTLGLSATPYRNDGLKCVFQYYIGPILYQSNIQTINRNIVVNMLTYDIQSEEYTVELRNEMDKPDSANMMNNIARNPVRTDMCIKYIKELYEDPNRVILAMSARKENLIAIHDHLANCKDGSGNPYSMGYYLGPTSEEEREKTIECRIILGIDKLCNEAFNVPALNTIFLLTPIKNNYKTKKFNQTVGRILRKKHDINPIIVDIYDKFSIYKGMYYTRRKYFLADSRFHINNIEITCEDDFTIPLLTEYGEELEEELDMNDVPELKQFANNKEEQQPEYEYYSDEPEYEYYSDD